jgi:hypothetical protein
VGLELGAGDTYVLQVHYNLADPNVIGQSDRTRGRLRLSPSVERQAMMLLIDDFLGTLRNNPPDVLEPGVPNARYTWTRSAGDAGIPPGVPVEILNVAPHMHARGKDMTYTATYPDGRKEIVLRVPKFDFGWQTEYQLATPLTLPKGSKLHVVAHYDNSAANRHNPDPAATVRWGDQTWEEMMIGFFTYTAAGPAVPATASR